MEHDPILYVIYTCTGMQAIKDGLLVDISAIAKNSGFVILVEYNGNTV